MVCKLSVLLWKHCVVRRRRFIHTPIEYLSPLVIFILLFSFRDKINPQSRHFARSGHIHYTESVSIDDLLAPHTIYYYPEMNATRRLMAYVVKKLNNSSGNVGGHVSVPIASEEDIPADANYNYGMLKFHNFNANASSELPDKLNYTIRVELPYRHIENKVEDGEVYDQHPAYGKNYEPFVRLQWAVDSAYLELKGNTTLRQRISLQEFPFVTAETQPNARTATTLLYAACMVALVLPFVFLVSRLVAERANGMREMIRMVGVPGRLLHLSHFLDGLPAGVLYAVVGGTLCVAGPNPLLRQTSLVLLFIIMILNYVTLMAFAFVCSCMLNSDQYAASFASTIYILACLPGLLLGNFNKFWLQLLVGLLPGVPLDWFWKVVAELEVYGEGATFQYLMAAPARNVPSVFFVIVMSMLQVLLYALLAWYLDQVFPGPYGQYVPWNFFVKKGYWTTTQVLLTDDLEELDTKDHQDRYFEPTLHDAEVGIRVIRVSKEFSGKKVLNNVSLSVYKGEITVLLGHNGAGKTTLMSIICGLMSATTGQVYVGGLDTATQTKQMRRRLGLCPQHNLFFPDLTILEHVKFYTLLKGCSFAEAKRSSCKLLSRLGLSDKMHNMSAQLSGGMQRRLQLACALAGDADVLVLDEPTAGLDVETRRELWDLLLSLRGERSVLLSTHFMEEADALGDRVAALQDGNLRCFATPMFLKRAIGTGYRLTLTTHERPNEPKLTAAVTSHVHNATVKEQTPNSISYNLPSADIKHFPALFNALEGRRAELGVDAIGVGVSTLEEVFLKLCSGYVDFTKDELDGIRATPKRQVYHGLNLYTRQLVVLFNRQLRYFWKNKKSFLALQVFVPLLIICGFTYLANEFKAPPPIPDMEVPMDLGLFGNVVGRRALYAFPPELRSDVPPYPGVQPMFTNNVVDEMLRIGKHDMFDYNKYLVGVEMNETDARFHFTTVYNHAAPVAANTLANVFATQMLGGDGLVITTNNRPLVTRRTLPELQEPKSTLAAMNCVWWTIIVVMVTLINAALLPCTERVTSARHLHTLMGARPPVLWAATLTAHLLVYSLALLLPVLLAYATIDNQRTLNQIDFLCVLGLTMFLGSATMLSFMYLFTFCFTYLSVTLIMVPIVVLFGVVTPSVSTAMRLLDSETEQGFWYYVVSASCYIMPPHTFVDAALRAAYVARNNAVTNLNPDSRLPTFCYICFQENAPGIQLLVLFGQFLVYMSLVVVTQYGVFLGLWEHVSQCFRQSHRDGHSRRFLDSMVQEEENYVKKVIGQRKNKITDAMLVHDVRKTYMRMCSKSCHAVNGVSFSVKKGECFGLLGVNGAGKSTIFKMLTGSVWPTGGSVFADGYYLKTDYHQYMRSLSYCPQFSGLDEFLTGAQNLRLLLTLRGLGREDVESETKTWIEIVGLETYANRSVRKYSGGCARRMAAAAALCGGARVMLLDEPSAGVDVGARRRLWAAVRRAAAASAVIISSHSMDETEALCSRIAIMSMGRVRALGSAGALRAAHAAGHAVVLRVDQPRASASKDETDGAGSEISRLKSRLHETFNCTLKDDHKTTLHYHINETMPYSELFLKLEELHKEFPLIHDYSVTETTLEEVFLTLAKEGEGARAHV